jgi:hypothetical protein
VSLVHKEKIQAKENDHIGYRPFSFAYICRQIFIELNVCFYLSGLNQMASYRFLAEQGANKKDLERFAHLLPDI